MRPYCHPLSPEGTKSWKFPFAVTLVFALGATMTTVDLFAPDAQRVGTVREAPGGQLDLFNRDSRRIGWGRRSPDGSVELFDQRGNRIGESRGGRIILRHPVLRRGIEGQ